MFPSVDAESTLDSLIGAHVVLTIDAILLIPFCDSLSRTDDRGAADEEGGTSLGSTTAIVLALTIL
jgi:hypothetical protein